ncbi:hypothetical protein K438DRAFT_1969888 [Mycena galopus ATCC 62051]|nr:hypothetical protein K438DRAFT_1969888 [Mycena galopus ATCC 62051]
MLQRPDTVPKFQAATPSGVPPTLVEDALANLCRPEPRLDAAPAMGSITRVALHALAQCAPRLLLANAAGEEALAADWAVVRGFAVLGLERARYSFNRIANTAVGLFHMTFQRPRRDEGALKNQTAEEKRVTTIIRKPLLADIESALFDYDAGFLQVLGRISLDLEAHSGLYPLHAHLNHGCAPNASVRHLDWRRALARITVRALADIEPGQELLITYVDPAAQYAERRAALEAWGFVCQCAGCVEEGRDWKPPEGRRAWRIWRAS